MERLLKVSLVISLLGILVLTYLSLNTEPKLSSISNLSSENINQEVKILGQITKIKDFDSFSVLYIKEKDSQADSTIQGIVDSANFTINSSKEYYFIGQISEYNKTLQINIEKITQL